MSLTAAPLTKAIDDLRASLDGVITQAHVLADQSQETVAQLEFLDRIKSPGLTFEPGALPGLSAAQAVFDDIEGFPEKMNQTQGEVLAKIAAFDDAVGRISKFDEACGEMLDERKAAIEALRERLETLEERMLEDISRLVEEAGDSLKETFADGMEEAGQETFDEMETLLKDAFADFDGLTKETAELLESTANDVLQSFEEDGKEIFEDVIEARARQLVEAQIVAVIEDLGLSQVISTSSQVLYSSVATAAPNLVIALKAVGPVKSILEAMKP